MGQKTHPIGFRVGISKPWLSKWFSQRNYADWLHEDIKFRETIKKRLYTMGVSHIEIERAGKM